MLLSDKLSLNTQNLVRLIRGELLTNPKISSVINFTTKISNVELGSCFLTSDASKAKEAITLGAYAIIFEGDAEIFDGEIAYIKVDSLKSAKFRIMRYFTTLNGLEFVEISSIMREILEFMRFDKSVVLVDKEDIFETVLSAPSGSIIFSDDDKLIKAITQNFKILKPNFELKIVNQTSIFYLKFSYAESEFFLNLPEIFAPEVYALIQFLSIKDRKFRFKEIQNFRHFSPIFVDKFYSVKEFGQSYRAFIVESDEEIFKRSSEFLKSKFKQDIITFSHKNIELESDIKFINLCEIKTTQNFRYALILGDKDEIFEMLCRVKASLTLF
ncbi:MAG: hypothetical protein GXZ15_04375 [Campylobacter sp.]|nr:hypothetical protein [Campylobacter sp.]